MSRPDYRTAIKFSCVSSEIVTEHSGTVESMAHPILFDPVETPYLVPFDDSFKIAKAPTEAPDELHDKKEMSTRSTSRSRSWRSCKAISMPTIATRSS